MHADIIITNAQVLTMDPGRPNAEAIAISGNCIARVGSIEEIRASVGIISRRPHTTAHRKFKVFRSFEYIPN